MRPGWFLDSNGERVEQILRNEKGEQLGLMSILKRRGSKHLNHGGCELDKICNECKHGISKETRLAEGTYNEKCCLTCRIKTCRIIFYPKYHCELNFIEMVWGWLKSHHRRSCTYTFKYLEENLPLSLENTLPLSFVRRTSQHCFRFMQGYRHGLSGSILEYAVKRYTSHRAIPVHVFITIENDYEEIKKEKTIKSKK